MNEEEREASIGAFFPLVRRIATRVRRVVPTASLDDLIGDGSIGLIRSVDGYDASRGIPFERYASKVILGAMLNGLRRMDPVPERARRCVRKAQEKRYHLALERGSLPSLEEMEHHPELPGLRHARMIAFRYSPRSLECATESNDRALLDHASDPALAVLSAWREREVRECLAILPERQRRVVLLHYYRHVSLHAISAHFNVTPQRVSQIHLTALATLRAGMGER